MKIVLLYKDGHREALHVPWSVPRIYVDVAEPPPFDFRVDAPRLPPRQHRTFKRVGNTDVYEES